jgi:NADH-quinone oxidoreductase subunit G
MQGRTGLPAPAAGDPQQLLIKEIDAARTVVVIASDTAREVPIVNLRVKKAVAKGGARLVIVHPDELDLDRWSGPLHHLRPAPDRLARAVRELAGHEFLQEGPIAILHGDAGGTGVPALREAVAALAAATGARVMPLYRGTNERGLLGLGLAAEPDDLEGVEAVLCWGPPAPGSLPGSANFVAVWDSLLRPEHGSPDVVLPDITFAEKQGSYTNLEGRVQFLRPVLEVSPPLRESWDVLCELGRRLGLPLDYTGIYQLQREAAAAFPTLAALAQPPAPSPPPTPVLYGPSRP